MPKDSGTAPPKRGFRKVIYLFTQAFQGWNEDNCGTLGAALAYYTAFSLAPLILVLLAVFGVIFGR
jgi:membrane protein